MDYAIDYTEGGTYTLTVGGVVVLTGIASYADGEASAQEWLATNAKRVQITRVGRVVEYDCYLGNEYVGSKRTRIEAEQYLDKLAFERLSGQAQVRG